MRKGVVAAVATGAVVMALAVVVRRWRRRTERMIRESQRIVRKFARECATPVTKLWNIADDMVTAMQAGLDSNGQTNLAMLVAYLHSLPTGDEKGLYYGVNIRATDFLILKARLGGKNEPISDLLREEFSIPSDVIIGTSKELFDFIALQLVTFISSHDIKGTNNNSPRKRNLGITLSYPVDQAASSSGTAIKWKSFAVDDTCPLKPNLSATIAPGLLGQWIPKVEKQLINEMDQALGKHGLDFHVSAMTDETAGHLAGGRYYSKETVAAITLGQATNALYIETPQAVSKFKGLSEGEMVIDMQWGNFNSSHLPVTEFDASLDSESSNPGSRVFEKLISGKYLGEVVRKVLLKMAHETSLFGGKIPPKLAIPYLLGSPDMAAMHQDTSEDHDVVGEKLEEIFGIVDSNPKSREIVSEVCDIVTERGSRLAGAGIVAITKKLGRIANKRSVVIVEGGLYEHYRIFRNYLHSVVWEMLGNEVSDNVIIDHSHGGSGAGSLFLAASQTHIAGS